MKKIIITSGILIVLTSVFMISVCRKTPKPVAQTLVLSCNADVHLSTAHSGGATLFDGSLSLATLGEYKMAFHYSGKLSTPTGRFILSRTLIMKYFYHPENHVLELHYERSNINDIDNAPDSAIYHDLINSNPFILYLTRFNTDAWLVSGFTSPFYVCNDN